MGTRVVVLSTLAAAAFAAFAAGPARAQDENPTTPGAIPNPGSYQGSMELQRRSDEQDQQFRQQQSQPSYQGGYQQPRYNAPSRGGYAPRRAAPPPPERPRTEAQAFGKEAPGDLMAEKLAAKGDYAGALRLWRPLAAQGDVNAEYNLGVMYDVGHGVPANPVQAAFWYRKAAEKGMGAAMLNLATIIVQHARGPADLVPAYTWMRIAANRDPAVRPGAMHNMSLIGHMMSYDQVTRAEAAAHAWAPR
jgi:hypothetical protein